MNIDAAIAITNKNMLTSYATLIYSTILFYISILGMLGVGVVVYSLYGIFLEIPVLLVIGFIVFFPGYLYSQFDQFVRIIKKEKRSFNRITDVFIIGSIRAIPITLVKIILTSIFMLPSIILFLYLRLDIVVAIVFIANYIFASTITEYLFSYVYYYYLILRKDIVRSFIDGSREALLTIKNLPIFFLNYIISLVQLIPVINMMIMFLIPWIYVLSAGKMFKR